MVRKAIAVSALLWGLLTACDPVVEPTVYAVGDTGPGGGIVFYDKGNAAGGWQYLEMDLTLRTAEWLNPAQYPVGASGTGVGDGLVNTNGIVAAGGAGSYAATVCSDLVAGGKSDWYLPSKDELDAIYTDLKLAGLGGLTSEVYWSSTEASFSDAWAQDLGAGTSTQNTIGQTTSHRFVAVRQFAVE
jgi:hypothetical protein